MYHNPLNQERCGYNTRYCAQEYALTRTLCGGVLANLYVMIKTISSKLDQNFSVMTTISLEIAWYLTKMSHFLLVSTKSKISEDHSLWSRNSLNFSQFGAQIVLF